jgi:hypothetical protein
VFGLLQRKERNRETTGYNQRFVMNVTGTKRRSRFEAVETEEPELKKPAIDISAAAARAAELSREVASKVGCPTPVDNGHPLIVRLFYLCM